MDCERSNQVHLYHDGELSAGERDALEAHLKACGDCQALLNDLRSMSRMLAVAPMVDAPADAMNRIRAARYVVPDAGVLKIAGWLTAAAAAVLLAALPVWRQERQDRTTVVPAVASADVLDTVAVNPPSDPDTGRTDLVALAQWMSDDLSANERR
jgi:anti-sigma factor RsiW